MIAKLLAFTAAMITLPIGSYFLSVNTLFGGKYPTPQSPNSRGSYMTEFQGIPGSAEAERDAADHRLSLMQANKFTDRGSRGVIQLRAHWMS